MNELQGGAGSNLGRRQILLAVFIAAVVFRIGLLFSGLVDVVFMTADSGQYDELARSLLAHGTFAESAGLSMYRTPGYPALVALVYALMGTSQIPLTAVQIVLDSLTCVIVVDMALRHGVRGRALALTAALAVTCLYTAVYSYQLMTETTYCFALTLAIWVWDRPDKREEPSGTTPLRALITGLVIGAAVLVRPAMMVPGMLFGLGICARILFKLGWRNLRPRAALAPLALGLGVAVCIIPWIVRNHRTFPEEFARANTPYLAPLGFKVSSSSAFHFYQPDFKKFLASYEQPYVQIKFTDPPVMARYVYPGEEEEVRAAYARLGREVEQANRYTSDEMLDFRAITAKRYQAAPRLHLTAPASMIAKVWITPRIAVLWRGRSGHNSSRALIVGYTIYSSVFLLGILGLFWGGLREHASSAAIYLAAMLIGHTFIYALWLPFPQSRYAVAVYPLLCLGIGTFAQRWLSRRHMSMPVSAAA